MRAGCLFGAVAIMAVISSSVSAAPFVGECGFLIQNGNKVEQLRIANLDFEFLPRLQKSALADGGTIGAIFCRRPAITFEPDDYRVLTEGGVPFYVISAGRSAVLEMADGQFRIRSPKGAFTDGELTVIQSYLDRVQLAVQAEHK